MSRFKNIIALILFSTEFECRKGRLRVFIFMHYLYYCWRDMIARCYNEKVKCYHRYGGRGITVCDRWLFSLDNFKKDMGEKPTSKHSIDRIDVNGNYEPSNCKWSTPKEQANNRRNNKGNEKHITRLDQKKIHPSPYHYRKGCRCDGCILENKKRNKIYTLAKLYKAT